MTLDEAIKHSKVVAKEKRKALSDFKCSNEHERNCCIACAEEHEQLAEFLQSVAEMLEEKKQEEADTIHDFILWLWNNRKINKSTWETLDDLADEFEEVIK